MDDAPTTKEAILERMCRAGDAIDATVSGLTDEELLATIADGEWSVRDMLAHMAADLRWFTVQMEAMLAGREPTAKEAFTRQEPPDPRFDLSTQDGRNAAQYEMNRHLSLEEVRGRFDEYRRRVSDAIVRTADDQFSRPFAIAPLDHVMQLRPAEDGQEAWPLWRWIAGNTWHHFEDHLKDIEARVSR